MNFQTAFSLPFNCFLKMHNTTRSAVSFLDYFLCHFPTHLSSKTNLMINYATLNSNFHYEKCGWISSNKKFVWYYYKNHKSKLWNAGISYENFSSSSPFDAIKITLYNWRYIKSHLFIINISQPGHAMGGNDAHDYFNFIFCVYWGLFCWNDGWFIGIFFIVKFN